METRTSIGEITIINSTITMWQLPMNIPVALRVRLILSTWNGVTHICRRKIVSVFVCILAPAVSVCAAGLDTRGDDEDGKEGSKTHDGFAWFRCGVGLSNDRKLIARLKYQLEYCSLQR